ncbi:hypothetical protein SCUP515_07190 [Seiridium cupressi]
MATNQTREEGDFFPSSPDLPNTPATEQTLAEPKRSITPRGPLFPNLGEAHRNITSRLASSNPFYNPAGDNHSSTDIPLQDISSPTSTEKHDSLSTRGPSCAHASGFVSPHPSRSTAGRSLTDRQSIAKLPGKLSTTHDETAAYQNDDGHRVVGQQPRHPDSTSTVSRIVDQYAGKGDRMSSGLANSEPTYIFWLPKTQATGICYKFPDQGNHGPSNSDTRAHHESNPPSQLQDLEDRTVLTNDAGSAGFRDPSAYKDEWSSAAGVSQAHLSTLVQPSPSPRISTFGSSDKLDLDWLKYVETCGDVEASRKPLKCLMPPPLRIPSNRDNKKYGHPRENPFSNEADCSVGSGLGGTSTESNDDPFKYDNDHYRRVRQLGKEREVSLVLKRMSHSRTCVEPSNGALDVSPQKPIEPGDFVQNKHDEKGRSSLRFGRHEGSFFDPVAFSALQGDAPEDQDTNVKVVINKSCESGTREVNNINDRPFGLSIDREDHAWERRPHDNATDGDWITEATSEADFDSLPGNGQFTQGIKATGSSIADYSDDGYATPFSNFGSRNQIVRQHPAESKSYEVSDVRDPKQDRFALQSHTSRVTGYGQSPSRMAPGAIVSQTSVFNPFRRDYKRANASSYFTYKADRYARARYEFRDSTSTYGPAGDYDEAGFRPQATIPSISTASSDSAQLLNHNAALFTDLADDGSNNVSTQTQKHKRGHSRQPALLSIPPGSYYERSSVTDNEQGELTQAYAITCIEGPPSASSKFSFKLLDLSEAQEIQKVRRASEDTSQTDSIGHWPRSCSISSGHPVVAPLSRPSAAYMRRDSHIRKGSRLSSTFTPPPWQTPNADSASATRECTPLDASASRLLTLPGDNQAKTPSASKKGWSRQEDDKISRDHRSGFFPADKRIHAKASDHTLKSIRNRDNATARAAEDHYVSTKAKSRRRIFFYVMLCLSILPFFALLVLSGNFDASLTWLTHGEVHRLTKKQRKVIKVFFVVECIIYASMVAAIIAYYVTASKAHH